MRNAAKTEQSFLSFIHTTSVKMRKNFFWLNFLVDFLFFFFEKKLEKTAPYSLIVHSFFILIFPLLFSPLKKYCIIL